VVSFTPRSAICLTTCRYKLPPAMRHFRDAQTLHSICKKEHHPQQWKESSTVLTYKKGDKTGCSNYPRPSLLPTTYKIVSAIPLRRPTPYTDEVHVFGHNRPTTDQTFCVRQTLDKRNGSTMRQCISYLYILNRPMSRSGEKYCKYSQCIWYLLTHSMVHDIIW
jgi:hypothetical protein